jgi:superfamily II DNA/RNA helicase
MTFSILDLSPDLLRAIGERNYPAPTPIQRAAIPPILEGRDVWACAQTGSGKTAAFAWPLLQQTLNHGRDSPLPVRTLILVPTRELAAQVGESIRSYARYLPRPAKIVIVFGGLSMNPQMMALRGGADIVIATPGRLLDLVDNNTLSGRWCWTKPTVSSTLDFPMNSGASCSNCRSGVRACCSRPPFQAGWNYLRNSF